MDPVLSLRTGSGSWCVSILTRGQVVDIEGSHLSMDPGASIDVK